MSTQPDFRAMIAAAAGPRELVPLLTALGLEPTCDPVPPAAWGAYGLAPADGVGRLMVAGRAGSLDALLVELAPDAGPERGPYIARRVRSRNPARLHLFVVASDGYERLSLGVFGLDEAYRHLTLDRARVLPSDLEALREMVPAAGEAGLELVMRYIRALDRSGITRRFFADFRVRRAAVADAWSGLPAEAADERAQLGLLLLSRLTFLYFLQRRGALAGDDRYLANLFGRWNGGSMSHGPSFYRARLRPLFFGVLNRQPEDRDAEARLLGPLPYLNGGLFERHALERRFPELDLPDAEVGACFEDLLDRYRFTGAETGGSSGGGSDAASGAEGAAIAVVGHGVDPEILGRVFEGLMHPDRRGDTGSFYTPAPVVDRVVRETISTYLGGVCSESDARAVADGRGGQIPAAARNRARERLERVRILDPACGSGAFLLGALERVTAALDPLSDRPAGAIRREVVANALHGVDLLDDAALLCSLRLWLALSGDEDEIRPLPNLDRRIRQGDSLIDPLDLAWSDLSTGDGASWHPLRDPWTRRALRAVPAAARRYLESRPEDRAALRAHLERAEARLARRWVRAAGEAGTDRLRGLRARAADRDLFGERTDDARHAEALADRVGKRVRELDRLAVDLEEKGSLPFFSFGVHFAGAADGFDVIVSNPPWIRSHRWPAHVKRLARRYAVCRDAGWAGASRLTGAPGGAGAQVDLSLLFLERALRLLAPGGVLAMLLPAKALRALYGGEARRMSLADLEIVRIEDHALDQRSIFRADAFTAVLIGRKRPASPGDGGDRDDRGRAIRVMLSRRGAEPLETRVRQRELPLFPDDPASPWLLAPPDAVAVFRRMQRAGSPLGTHEGLRVRRGIMTGANDALIFTRVEPKLGGLAVVEAAGHGKARRRGAEGSVADRYRGVVEMASLRPLVRGADVDAFRFGTDGYVAWCHDADTGRAAAPPRMQRYLEGHRRTLEGRSGWRAGMPLGVVFRLSRDTVRPKVAWHDLSDTLRAVALPAMVRVEGADRELIPLNTVYFLPTHQDRTAVLLAGILNSLPVRTMARAVAERAKDARFRFFAWTVSSVPLPAGWQNGPAAAEIQAISEAAHREGGIDSRAQGRLDSAAARLYGLDTEELEPLRQFDAWLRGGAQ